MIKPELVNRTGDPKCVGSGCPSVYEDGDDLGSYIIQGIKLTEVEKRTLGLPENEDAVRIPRKLIDEMRE